MIDGGMTVTALRPGVNGPTVEALLARIDSLARERQDLRVHRAATAILERNRLALVRCQWELSYALIRQYRARVAPRSAA